MKKINSCAVIRAGVFSSVLLFSLILFNKPLIAQIKSSGNDGLSLREAVDRAILIDPWLVGSHHQQQSVESLSVAANTLPDPKLTLGLANLPANDFSFERDPMSQFKVSISQSFARGESLSIKQKQFQQLASQFPYQRENRKALTSATVAKLWLDAFAEQKTEQLIEENRKLFEQLTDIVQASYSSTVANTRQQDIIRSQLELTRLDDRLTEVKLRKETLLKRLLEWLSPKLLDKNDHEPSWDYFRLIKTDYLELNNLLPSLNIIEKELVLNDKSSISKLVLPLLMKHPAILEIDKKIEATKTGISLAKQKYKPEWGVSASYGYRDDVNLPNGQQASDLFSIVVSFDLPIFTSNKQDKYLSSAISKTEAAKTEKTLLLRKMLAKFESNRSRLNRLYQRESLYQDKLLPQLEVQSEATLSAYTNDDGDFDQVIRARISQLNARIELVEIQVEIQKTIAELNYFFIQKAENLITYKNASNLQEGK